MPDIVTAGLPSVGLRMPAHPIALALLEAAGIPLAAPSANRFTASPHTQHSAASNISSHNGPCSSIESTVISFAGEHPRILRPGMISQTAIEDAIGPVEVGAGAESPGQHPKHYSPRARIVLGDPPREGRGAYLPLSAMPKDAEGYAESLYATLHALDARRLDWIAIELPPDAPEWAGVRDRLMRAAATGQQKEPAR